MISRENFIFTIGYDGNTAIVDEISKRKYSRLSTEELTEKGLFKAALSSALYEGDSQGLGRVLESYNQSADRRLESVEHLKRTFGVFEVPEGISKIMLC